MCVEGGGGGGSDHRLDPIRLRIGQDIIGSNIASYASKPLS